VVPVVAGGGAAVAGASVLAAGPVVAAVDAASGAFGSVGDDFAVAAASSGCDSSTSPQPDLFSVSAASFDSVLGVAGSAAFSVVDGGGALEGGADAGTVVEGAAGSAPFGAAGRA